MDPCLRVLSTAHPPSFLLPSAHILCCPPKAPGGLGIVKRSSVLLSSRRALCDTPKFPGTAAQQPSTYHGVLPGSGQAWSRFEEGKQHQFWSMEQERGAWSLERRGDRVGWRLASLHPASVAFLTVVPPTPGRACFPLGEITHMAPHNGDVPTVSRRCP